jgi:hypothetical protein
MRSLLFPALNVYRRHDGDIELLANQANTNFHDCGPPRGILCLYAVAAVNSQGVEGLAVSVLVTTR